jgi:alanyl-tRNA synthetase
MSSHLVTGALLLAVFVTNVWWWGHTRTVRKALTTSQKRDERIAGQNRRSARDANESGVGTATATQTTLAEAATRADCPPEELPDRIQQFQERIADLEDENDRLRDAWAQSWFDLFDTQSTTGDWPLVVQVDLKDGTTAVAQAFADVAQNSGYDVVIVAAYADGAVTATVDESVHDQITADAIIDDIVAAAGGGGGGSAGFATGGGCDPERLSNAIKKTAGRLEAKLTETDSAQS